jgi:N-acetylglucosamine kinase-like BadF-type ATPase
MVLVADSGSTKTDWRILDSTQTVGEVQTVGFNPYYQDADSIATELQAKLLPYCKDKITGVFYYGTGITNEEKAGVLRTAILKTFGRIEHIDVQSDVLGAARAACGHQEGIGCILGTGSNSCYFDGEKIAFQVPPLGFWLGDEGSGGHLGKSVVLTYLHKEMPASIRQLFEEKYGIMDRLMVLDNAYHKPFPNRYFAAFSRFLLDNIHDRFCYKLAAASFNLFFEKYILKYPMCYTVKLNFVGSVGFYYEKILREVAGAKKLHIGNILATPIDGLVKYHTEKI